MSERRFRKGDRVSFYFVNRIVQGIIKEDRGPLGIKGRHLYAVEFCSDSVDGILSLIELPAVDLQLIDDAVSAK